jgi:hypothetical protein
MKKYIDFTIKYDKEFDKKTIFRFHTASSHVHGFNEDCPNVWKDVYKVYYSWQVIEINKTNEKILFDMSIDECSDIVNLPKVLDYVIKKRPKFIREQSVGQPGSIWEIKYRKYHDWGTGKREPEKDFLEISVWNNYTKCGFRFYLDINETKSFIAYLENVNAYMLKHSEPI